MIFGSSTNSPLALFLFDRKVFEFGKFAEQQRLAAISMLVWLLLMRRTVRRDEQLEKERQRDADDRDQD